MKTMSFQNLKMVVCSCWIISWLFPLLDLLLLSEAIVYSWIMISIVNITIGD